MSCPDPLRRYAALALILLLAGVPAVCPAREVPASGSIEVAFTPGDDAEGAIVRAIDRAQKTIHVQAYLFTSRALARALIAARQRGVSVEVLADREMLVKGENSQIPLLAEAGIPIWLETRYAVAHNKIILIDATGTGSAVITGSYNFTYSAQARNAENLLILRGNPSLSRVYLDHWQHHRSEATAYPEGVAE